MSPDNQLPTSPKALAVLLIGLVGVFLAACSPDTPQAPLDGWLYEHVLTLDPIDAPKADLDLIALYQRINGNDFQLRIDYLDLDPNASHDLYITFDTGEPNLIDAVETTRAEVIGDLSLVFPVEGTPQAFDAAMQTREDLIPRIIRDPSLDAAVISLNMSAVPELSQPFRVMVTTTEPGQTRLVDGIDPVPSDAPPPPQAPLFLAFWDTFPAYSPAQALRRWQGAHTGPFGGRHGLHTLIDAVSTYEVPLALLDLKNPKSISALDFIDPWEAIKVLGADNLIGLPESVPISPLAYAGHLPFLPTEEALQVGIRQSRETARRLDLPSTRTLFAPLVPENIPSRYELVILPPAAGLSVDLPAEEPLVPLTTDLVQFDGHTFMPLPDPGEDLQAYPDGLGMPARRSLVEIAYSDHSLARGGSRVVVLGGDLPLGSWGDPEYGSAAIRYIAEHPWMTALTIEDLVSAGKRQAIVIPEDEPFLIKPEIENPIPYAATGRRQVSGLSISEMHADFMDRLAAAPESVQSLAWDAYYSYLDPNPPESGLLPTLRQGYFGQLGALLSVISWLEDPGPRADCSSDPDLDGEAECILATDTFFYVFEPRGARLTHAFVIVDGEVTQWIAPYSQFIHGLSDPTSWQLELGPAADPGDVPGAFSDHDERWQLYAPIVSGDGLVFISEDGSRRKTFTPAQAGLQVEYEDSGGAEIKFQIPLALDPITRYSPAWRSLYTAGKSGNSSVWSLKDELRIRIQSSADVRLLPFFEDEAQLEGPEDPNYNYPPGHFNPFPFALVEVAGSDKLTIELTLSK